MNLKYVLLSTLLNFCSLNVVLSANKNIWAVLVAGYNRYQITYAFEASVYKMYKLLRKRGVLPEQIITISPDAVAFNVLNPVPGFVGFAHTDTEFTESNNQYEDVIVDYNSNDLTTEIFFGVLNGNCSAVKGIGNEKVLKSGPKDTVYIYWVALGTYGVITLNNRQFLWAEQLVPFLEELREQNHFRKMIFTLESGSAGSIFDDYLDPRKNILVHACGGRFNELYLCHKNPILNAYTSTCSTYLHSFVIDTVLLKSGEGRKKNIFDIFSTIQSINTSPMDGHNLYGHLSLGKVKLMNVFGEPSRKHYEFELQLKSDANVDIASLSDSDTETLKNQMKDKQTLSRLLLEDDTVSIEEKIHLANMLDKIISDSIAGLNISPNDIEEQVQPLTMSEIKCYKDSFNKVLTTCFNDKNNHLFLVKAHKLAKLCSLDITSEKIIVTVNQICNERR